MVDYGFYLIYFYEIPSDGKRPPPPLNVCYTKSPVDTLLAFKDKEMGGDKTKGENWGRV